MWNYFAPAIVSFTFGVLCVAQDIPATQAKALDGSQVSFPQKSSGKPLLLVIGFSHKSGEQCGSWNKRLKPTYMREPRILYYELADFQGVPSLIMRMILHGVRREVPSDEHSRFVPLYTHEDEWKKLVRYAAPDEAYLVAADPSGHVLWQTHGTPSDTKYSELQAVLGKQIGRP